MRYFALLGVVLAVATTSAPVRADTLDVTVVTGRDDLVFSRIGDYDLVEIAVDRGSLEGVPGEPWLATRDIHVLLPPGSRAASVTVTVDSKLDLPGTYTIYPAQRPVRLSDPGPHPFAAPDPGVYAQATPLRTQVAALVDTVIVRGYHVAVVRVHPLDYVPAAGRLVLRRVIHLSLELETGASARAASSAEAVRYRVPEPLFERWVTEDVVNPHDLPTLGYELAGIRSPTDPDDVKYLLIGATSMFDEFQPLLDWKTRKGVPAEAVDVSWIYANYAGEDNQERIKACIKDYVENKGTVWVVLAGDNTIVPDRDCFGDVNNGDTTDTTIPTDLYYAGLDDMDWDDNDNGVAAQLGTDSIDMGPDVFVGRLPVRTAAHATAIVAKTLQYEKNPLTSGFAEKMLLSGVTLWDWGDAEGKSEGMYVDWIDPYWTPVRYRFYDSNTDFPGGSSYQVTDTHVNDQLANGFNLFHMATHGDQTIWSMESGSYSSFDASNASNADRYTNVVTLACITNAFENSFGGSDPCLSEAFIRNPDGGAVTYIGGSRYGWGYSGTHAHGASLKYDRMFYEFLLTGEPHGYAQQVGAVYTRMKEYWIGSSGSYGAMRWCQFSVNLMGDPELPLYTLDPSALSPVFPTDTHIGPQIFLVQTAVADAQVCLSQDGVVYTYGKADEAGDYQATIYPTTGTLYVTVTAPNRIPFEGTTNCTGMADCNNNTVADHLDVSGGTSLDCNSDFIPDECQLAGNDCNANNIPDDCDIAGGTSADCQPNQVPDDCDIAGSTSADCQPNQVPDDCELSVNDCNTNTIPDDCELAGNDCNTNGRPDECDVVRCMSLWDGFQPNPPFSRNVLAGTVDYLPNPAGDDIFWENPSGTAIIDTRGCQSGLSSDLAVRVDVDDQLPDPRDGYVLSEYFQTEDGAPAAAELVYGLSFNMKIGLGIDSNWDWEFILYDAVSGAPVVQLEFVSAASTMVQPQDRGYILVKNPTWPSGPEFINTGAPIYLDVCCSLEVVLDNLNDTVTVSIDGEPLVVTTPLMTSAERMDYFRLHPAANGASSSSSTNVKLDGFDYCVTGQGVPPAAIPDCNTNGVLDECDIADGTDVDCNGNLIPDECDAIGAGDFDADGDVDLEDYAALADCIAGPGVLPDPTAPECADVCLDAFDSEYDLDLDLADLAEFQASVTVD
ncbi:MAG: hypothetical protein GY842_16280 [bacterium]|nr:hypothetical protein [bacterium]